MPLANAYIRPENAGLAEETFPLAVAFCPACYLVQLVYHVDPATLFSEYAYFSSYSDSMLDHARHMAEELSERFRLGPRSRVIEIASNDGYLLRYFIELGIHVQGIEPARNIAAEANKGGVPTLNTFFGRESVGRIIESFGRGDIIIGNNVLAHVPDINGFFAALVRCLNLEGAAVFEFPYVRYLLDRTEFDTVYHEHVFYYSLSAIKVLAERWGLEVFDVVEQNIHGGSLRVFIQHRGVRRVSENVEKWVKEEGNAGLLTSQAYLSFSRKTIALKDELLKVLTGHKRSGKRLAAYGAPAKGNTLLNYCGIGNQLLDFTVDRNPHKQGMLLPGSRLPILKPQDLLTEMPDYAVLLPWNIEREIVEQQSEYLLRGGKFIVPIPFPKEVAA